jgi:hypothetical protein
MYCKKEWLKLLMKSFCVAIFFIFSLFNAHGADVAKELTLLWGQAEEDLPHLKEWRLYYSTTSGGPYLPVSIPPIVYDGSPNPSYTMTQTLSVPVNPGETVTYYFVMTAVSLSGNESDFSAEALNEDGSVGIDFSAPHPDVTVPVTLRITVKIVPPSP